MRVRAARIPKQLCGVHEVRCPYCYKDSSWSIECCYHPTIVRKHGDSVDLKERDKKTGYLLRLPDCPITGRILTEEG